MGIFGKFLGHRKRAANYRTAVFNRMIEMIFSSGLSTDQKQAANAGMVVLNQMLQDKGAIDPNAILERYRRDGLSVTDAAISFIDGTVTQLHTLGPFVQKDGAAQFQEITVALEHLLDEICSPHPPGKVIPRNGVFGRAATEHLRDFLDRA